MNRVQRIAGARLEVELRRAGSASTTVVRIVSRPWSSSMAAELLVLRDCIDALLSAMRVAKEDTAFKRFAAYLHAVEQVGSMARQNESWFKQTQGKVPSRA